LRIGDRERANHVDRLRKTLRIGPEDFADLVSGYPSSPPIIEQRNA
jgi:hypothetical protein